MVDAAGPFQRSIYQVPKACIALGIFTFGIGAALCLLIVAALAAAGAAAVAAEAAGGGLVLRSGRGRVAAAARMEHLGFDATEADRLPVDDPLGGHYDDAPDRAPWLVRRHRTVGP